MNRIGATRTQRRLIVEQLEDRQLLAALPAAALADDAYEQNDTRATAKDLGQLTASRTIGNLVQADANDWYRFTTTATAAAGSTASIAFTHASGDLDLELYSAAGKRLRVSQGITNGESISLAGLPAGTYFVRVYGYRGVTNPNYSLGLNLGSAVQTPSDDAYENNDTQALAANLGTLTTGATLPNLRLSDSSDWFRFTTSARGTSGNGVTIQFQNGQGNLALQLYSSSGTLLATSNGTGNSELVSLAGRAAGTYYVRIYSPTGATNPNYSLQISAPTPLPVTATTPFPVTTGSFDIQIDYAGFTPSQRAIFEQAAGHWESIIVGDLPNAIYNGAVVDDLLISATASDIDGVGGTLGQAGYDRARTTGTRLPFHGSMEFDSADLTAMERDGSLLNVIVHEIGHVLGIGTLWQAKGLLVGAGTSNPQYIGAQGVAAYRAIFGGTSGGVPVEGSGGGGTRDAHWSEAAFRNELMTGYINAGTNSLSRITVASLADLGYTVNLAAADVYARPGSAAALVTGTRSSSSPSGPAIVEPAFNPPAQPPAPAARNLAPALVFALWENLTWSRPASQPAAEAASPARSSSSWQAAVDRWLAGEIDLESFVASSWEN